MLYLKGRGYVLFLCFGERCSSYLIEKDYTYLNFFGEIILIMYGFVTNSLLFAIYYVLANFRDYIKEIHQL